MPLVGEAEREELMVDAKDVAVMWREGSSTPRVDIAANRFPYAIVWGPLGPLTCCCPVVGHMGIGDSQGRIHDFAGPYTIGVDDFMVGCVWRYVVVGSPADSEWDAAIERADDIYSERMHNICCDNWCARARGACCTPSLSLLAHRHHRVRPCAPRWPHQARHKQRHQPKAFSLSLTHTHGNTHLHLPTCACTCLLAGVPRVAATTTPRRRSRSRAGRSGAARGCSRRSSSSPSLGGAPGGTACTRGRSAAACRRSRPRARATCEGAESGA